MYGGQRSFVERRCILSDILSARPCSRATYFLNFSEIDGISISPARVSARIAQKCLQAPLSPRYSASPCRPGIRHAQIKEQLTEQKTMERMVGNI
jgi:hypothetical protein